MIPSDVTPAAGGWAPDIEERTDLWS